MSEKTIAAEQLFDALLERLHRSKSDVLSLIEIACPLATGLDAQLSQLDGFKSWLDDFRPLPPDVVEELRQFYTVQLTYHSNALEGNTLSQSETEIILSHGVTIGGHSLVEHLEVIGHRDAMRYTGELAHDSTPIGEREIKDLHSLIVYPTESATGQSEAGRFRSLDVRAAGTRYLYPPHYFVQELMDEFATWLQSDEAGTLHPVVYASQAHFRFLSIHPFRDGNGRTARLLMNLCLLRAGFPITIINNVRRSQYIDALIAGQSGAEGAAPLSLLVAEACRESFMETLRLLATATSSRGCNADFYRALLNAAPRLP